MLLTLLLFFVLSATPAQAAHRADSIRRAQLAELHKAGDQEGVLAVCRELVEYHKEQGNERELFNAYVTLLDWQQLMGRFDEAMAVLQEMSAEAEGNARGTALTEFCFGQFYLGNRQPAEAQPHYRRAFQMLQNLGENSRAIRAGFNLQAVSMNLNALEEGLAINDSTQLLLEKMERQSGKLQIGSRFKQSRYRFVIMQRLGRFKEAAALKDTLLHYHALLNDSSQDELVLSAVAQYEQAVGNKKQAYAHLDTLVDRNLRVGNYLKAARFRLALADFQRDNGDLALAVESYRRYAVEADSAQVHRTNDQLNALTKKFQLQELKLENRTVRQRNMALSLVSGLLLVLLVASLSYARALLKKNRILYQASLETIRTEVRVEEELMRGCATRELSADEDIYARLLELMQKEELFKIPNITRDELASRLGTNRTYLTEAVRSCCGQTFNDFLNHHRLRWAAEALSRNAEQSISSVGEDAGFASRSTFNRLFQQQFGMSPGAFRTAARG